MLIFSVALGVIAALAALVGGNADLAVFGLALMTGFGIFLAISRSEFAVIGSADADERQREIDNEAVRISYLAVVVVAVGGFLWELARGNGPGAFTLVCSVGGFTYMSATAYLRRRR